MRVVATAGHVDHGKSSLVLALTGTDPDRFEEEKRRGLTIDLGFAHTHAAVRARRSRSSTSPATCGSCATCSPASAGSTPACSSSPPPRAGSRRARSTCASSSSSASATASSRCRRPMPSTTTGRELASLDVADHVRGNVPARRRRSCPCQRDDGRRARRPAGRARRARRSHARPPPTAAGPGSGSTACSPPRAAAPWSPGRSPAAQVAVGEHVVVGPGRAAGPDPRASRRLGRTVDTIGPGNRVALNLAGIDHGRHRARRRRRPSRALALDRRASTRR